MTEKLPKPGPRSLGPRKPTRTPTLWRPHLEPHQRDLVGHLASWAASKIDGREPFSILAILEKDAGSEMVKYTFPTVDESFQTFLADIAAPQEPKFYAIAFRVFVNKLGSDRFSVSEHDSDGATDGILIAMERKGLVSSLTVFCPLEPSAAATPAKIDIPSACFSSLSPLLPSNVAATRQSLRSLGLGPLLDRAPQKKTPPRRPRST